MPVHKNVDRADARLREAERLSTLLDVSQALSGTLNLKASLHRVLEILATQYGAVRGLISLVDPEGNVRVQAADGAMVAGENLENAVQRRLQIERAGERLADFEERRQPLGLAGDIFVCLRFLADVLVAAGAGSSQRVSHRLDIFV